MSGGAHPHDRWIAQRMHHIEASGIRKVFELARTIQDPVNLSIGQPHFDVPEPTKAAAHAAIDRVRAGLPPCTKAILLNSPANPTGAVLRPDCVRDLALLARERGILLVSDEIYRAFCYDEPFTSPAEFNEDVLVIDGFSKAYGMTGWRLGFAHGPSKLIEEMIKLQQFTYVCAPSVVQWAGVAAWDFDTSGIVAEYNN